MSADDVVGFLLIVGVPLGLAGGLIGIGLLGGALKPSVRQKVERIALAAFYPLGALYFAWRAYGDWRDGGPVLPGLIAAAAVIVGVPVAIRQIKKSKGQGASS